MNALPFPPIVHILYLYTFILAKTINCSTNNYLFYIKLNKLFLNFVSYFMSDNHFQEKHLIYWIIEKEIPDIPFFRVSS